MYEQEDVADVCRDNNENWANIDGPYVIVTVGLPGRGKSYTANRISRWLNWKGLPCRVFNLGNYRRRHYTTFLAGDHWLEGSNTRDAMLTLALHDIKEWFEAGQRKVAIIDGTNSTRERRSLINDMLGGHAAPLDPPAFSKFVDHNNVLWIENICDDPTVIEQNILKVKIYNDDYRNLPAKDAVNDFKLRIAQYEQNYQQLDVTYDKNIKFIQSKNHGELVINSRLNNSLDMKLSYFVTNLHPYHNTVYICRHGESEAQIRHIIGTNPDLTDRGRVFVERLKTFIDDETVSHSQVDVLSSELKRSVETAKLFAADGEGKYRVRRWSQLNEIYGGHFEGSTYDAIQEKWPKTFALRQNNKYTHSWPGGESYSQLMLRLESIFLEIERSSRPMLIIAHQAVCRGIYAYLTGMKPEDCVDLPINSHSVYKFEYQMARPGSPVMTEIKL